MSELLYDPVPPSDELFSLEKTDLVIEELERMVDGERILIREAKRYPFDIVAAEMISKSFALARSITTLVRNGFPDEAAGMSRSLYEMSLYLRYITAERGSQHEKTMKFIQFDTNSRGFYFHLIEKDLLSDKDRADIEQFMADKNIPDDPTLITKHWSGMRNFILDTAKASHPLDPTFITQRQRMKEKGLAYQYTSAFVHCTQPGIDRYCQHPGEAIAVWRGVMRTDTSVNACMAVHLQLRAIIRYCFYGMNHKFIPQYDPNLLKYIAPLEMDESGAEAIGLI